MKKPIVAVLISGCLASPASFATDFAIHLIPTSQMGSVAVFGSASKGHQAGDFEVRLAAPFTVPPTFPLGCSDHTYLTTLASTDPDHRLFRALWNSKYGGGLIRPVDITITDEPALNAFKGRCSIKAVSW